MTLLVILNVIVTLVAIYLLAIQAQRNNMWAMSLPLMAACLLPGVNLVLMLVVIGMCMDDKNDKK